MFPMFVISLLSCSIEPFDAVVVGNLFIPWPSSHIHPLAQQPPSSPCGGGLWVEGGGQGSSAFQKWEIMFLCSPTVASTATAPRRPSRGWPLDGPSPSMPQEKIRRPLLVRGTRLRRQVAGVAFQQSAILREANAFQQSAVLRLLVAGLQSVFCSC